MDPHMTRRPWCPIRPLAAALTALAAVLALPGPARAQGEVWAPDETPVAGLYMERGKTKVIDVFGSVGLQEGVVLGGGDRSPLSLKPLVGVSFFEFKNSRILLGVTLAVPFSFEMGWGEDVGQVAIAPGLVVGKRPGVHWSWFAGLEVPIVITPERTSGAETEFMGGITMRGGATFWFLSGMGVYGEADVDIYFGSSSALVIGATVGLVVSWELYRFVPAGAAPQGGS